MSIEKMAEGWVKTDANAVRDDVTRLGGVEEAADYNADLARGQGEWLPLASDEGRAALRSVIGRLVE